MPLDEVQLLKLVLATALIAAAVSADVSTSECLAAIALLSHERPVEVHALEHVAEPLAEIHPTPGGLGGGDGGGGDGGGDGGGAGGGGEGGGGEGMVTGGKLGGGGEGGIAVGVQPYTSISDNTVSQNLGITSTSLR